jgi:hypothetical protein
LVAAGFQGLVGCISEAFGCTPNIDAGSSVQDATFYGQLIIPGRSTDTGADVAVRVSNFGHLAVYALERLGAYSDAERDSLMAEADRSRVEFALGESGYVVLPEDVLWKRYDGVNQALLTLYGDRRPEWFIRYFDYI